LWKGVLLRKRAGKRTPIVRRPSESVGTMNAAIVVVRFLPERGTSYATSLVP
jgi:hypothetical protein